MLLHWRFGLGLSVVAGWVVVASCGAGVFRVVGQVMLFELVMACFPQVVLWWSFGGLTGCGVGDEALGSGGDCDGGQLWVLAGGQ